ncbi:putative reverse transcriptase domain-containing protein [Tanacetum coccineum]|uniref:Reverse transcriptase domain-containing protein n=1 Tax=Tanacetum coccineum TaxID=301880 RepID=A0ABQ4WZR8_9ASTR
MTMVNGNGIRNGNYRGNIVDGNEIRNVNGRGDRPVAHECTYQDFMKCQPLGFKGTKGVVGLIRWSEKMDKLCFTSAMSGRISKWSPRRRRVENSLESSDNIQRECVSYTPKDIIPASGITGRRMGHWQGLQISLSLRRISLKGKNQNRGNKARVPDASGRAYALGGGDANPGSNTVTGTFLLNDHHAYMLFDSGADRSFVSNTFSALLDITPYALDASYAVELADGRTSETNTVFMGCTLGLLGHPFNIDLMPIELGSFDVIIGMDWLAKNHAVIVCDEKIVRIPYGNEILIVQGDKGDNEKKSKLSIISSEKVQKYMEKGCQLFLAQITVKESKDKSEEKRLEDVPTVRLICGRFLENTR